ncbi:cytidine deaminase [Candidatus Woesearchaeota archaeon]|nr:cytidine deaminase [Candidatus Woesearchaeota archaeon]
MKEGDNKVWLRPSWDQYFMKIAFLVSERSTCRRRHVGAVLVKDKRILTTGYNGAPKGQKDCLEMDCLRDELNIESGKDKHICRAMHAEANAIVQAALHGIHMEKATLYCTHGICSGCAKMLINAGVSRVVTCAERKEADFENMFSDAGIEFVKIEKPEMRINTLEYYR